MNQRNVKYRILKDKIFKYFIYLFTFLSTIPLIAIFIYIINKGIGAINWEFFVEMPKPPGEVGGGIANAIVGSFLLIVLAIIIAVPPAIAVGIYLSEDKGTKLADWVRNGVEILQGIPSIVFGIIAYVWVVLPIGHFSTFAGAVALAFMMLPIVAKSTEETLVLIPNSLKEASHALGVPYYKTVIKVLLPSGLSGIITGILLSVSRIAGETAPLLFTAFGNPFMNWDILKPSNSLPLLIFNYATSPYDNWQSIAWGASLVLIILILFLNILTKVLSRRWKVKF